MLGPETIAQRPGLVCQICKQAGRLSACNIIIQMVPNRFLCLHNLIQGQEQRIDQLDVEGGEMYAGAGVFVFDV
jgi:hypothetical protein